MTNKVVNTEPEAEMVQSICIQLETIVPTVTEIVSPHEVLTQTDQFAKKFLPKGIDYIGSRSELTRLSYPTLVSARKEFFRILYTVSEFYVTTCSGLADGIVNRWRILYNTQAELNTSTDMETWELRALIILDIFKESPHPDQEWVRRKLLNVVLDLLSLENPLAQTYQITNRTLLKEVGIIV